MAESFESLLRRANGYGITYEYHHKKIHPFEIHYKDWVWSRNNPAECKILLDALIDLASTLELDEITDRLNKEKAHGSKDQTKEEATLGNSGGADTPGEVHGNKD